MDTERRSELRSWALSLEERGTNEESRAAGKAIVMLVDEIEGLQSKLAAATAATPPPVADAPEPVPADAPAADEPAWTGADDRLHGSFWSRLKRTFGFD